MTIFAVITTFFNKITTQKSSEYNEFKVQLILHLYAQNNSQIYLKVQFL